MIDIVMENAVGIEKDVEREKKRWAVEIDRWTKI